MGGRIKSIGYYDILTDTGRMELNVKIFRNSTLSAFHGRRLFTRTPLLSIDPHL